MIIYRTIKEKYFSCTPLYKFMRTLTTKIEEILGHILVLDGFSCFLFAESESGVRIKGIFEARESEKMF